MHRAPPNTKHSLQHAAYPAAELESNSAQCRCVCSNWHLPMVTRCGSVNYYYCWCVTRQGAQCGSAPGPCLARWAHSGAIAALYALRRASLTTP